MNEGSLDVAFERASFYLGSGWREAPGLVLLILALAVRPTGVFGKANIRKV